MKKTKIIIPALSVLCLSAVASVSGTVAWFSATRSATTALSNIAVINPEGDMTLSTATKCNTSTSGTDVSVEDGYKLRDASVQVEAGKDFKVWAATEVDEDGKAEDYKEIEDSPYIYDSKIAYCAAWTMTFGVSGNNDADDYDFIFDIPNSEFEVESGEEIMVAYRLAIYTSDTVAIWAPNSSEDELTYISEGATATYTRDKEEVVLGTGTSLTATAVIWFEGEDGNCITTNLEKDADAMGSATLSFEARKA